MATGIETVNHGSRPRKLTSVRMQNSYSGAGCLFADGERLRFPVVCGGVGIYGIDFALTGGEVAAFRRLKHGYLGQLAEVVRSGPADFEVRRLPHQPYVCVTTSIGSVLHPWPAV